MKYLKTYKDHRKMNEEFVGGIFKKMKKMAQEKISMKFAQMFGTAKEADSIMDEYKKEVIAKQNEKMKALRAYAEYVKTTAEEGESDEQKMAELQNDFDESKTNYESQIKLSKEKFDLKLDAVVAEEKDKKIKNYIMLKKIEMQQELLSRELNLIHDEVGLSDEQLKGDSNLQTIIDEVQKSAKKNAAMEKEQRMALKQKGEVSIDFDMDEAKRNPEKYLWEESPFVKGDFEIEKGDHIKYFSVSNAKNNDKYEGTTATVEELLTGNKVGAEKQVSVRTDSNEEGFQIPLGKIISVDRHDAEKEEGDVEGQEQAQDEEVTSDGPVKSTSGGDVVTGSGAF